MANTQSSVDYMPFSALNPADSNQPVVFIGTSATLNIVINNATGGDIQVQPGTNASTMEIFMPSFFTPAEVQQMAIANLSQTGWGWAYNQTDNSLMLTFTGTAITWASTSSFTFDITGAISNGTSTMDTIQINLNNLEGINVQASVSQNLSLNNPVVITNKDITTVMQLNLDNQGSVFVSVASDPLNNTIYLNLKNTGTTPLYDDSKMWTGNPIVNVSFVYGNTAGALAPDTKGQASSLGSAWLISASLSTNQDWGYQNPVDTGQSNSPVWQLYPNPTNQDIIGTGANANVTFAFSNIASFTPTGHTQMYVQFTNFQANSTTNYNTTVYVIDIIKQDPPPTRGLLNFFSTAGSIIPLTGPQNNISIPLRWSMFYVDNINMICNVPGVQLMAKNYYSANMSPLNYDSYALVIPIEISQNTPVFITLQAFDNNGGYLNAMQFTVFISANFFTDPAGQTYPVVFINNQNWLAANYNYDSGAGCVSYNNNGGNRVQYGLLYNEATAQANAPDGWRLPTQTDWQNLFNLLGANAYQSLITGGTTNFNAQLGGYADNQLNFNNLAATGYYWASTQDGGTGNNIRAQFYSAMSSVNATGSFPPAYYLSARYVQNS
ncbi:FISUMP domain-containing protein [Mucilaginibacter xinganensis]|uniref:Fibrobacter succinogenes major paralogous domain-containing protein n=1 Tax=Mucilaginibacter xinganensis TaxID=1234841 RepID=A0A223NUJ3_9SPHI|nr:FISUMP domain-containing protein [Mucilaginibacter xinganensis]ASU33543.1 hypothetical protein MuYL_1645 [Mucilaginibacter xinganensis]